MNNDLIVIENYVDSQCIRHVHLMSNLEIAENVQRRWSPVKGGICLHEAGVWHFRAEYPHYGMLDIACNVDEKKGFRRFVVWSFEGCKSLTDAMREAKKEYCRLFSGMPKYAFVKKLPAVAESGMDVEEMTLMQADWMLEKCVAVGGRQ